MNRTLSGLNASALTFGDWLVAYIFIELNIFQWHEEVEEAEMMKDDSGSKGNIRQDDN